jgi:hypothetical protein
MKQNIRELIDEWARDWDRTQLLHECLGLTQEQYLTWAGGGELPLDCGLYDPDRGAP